MILIEECFTFFIFGFKYVSSCDFGFKNSLSNIGQIESIKFDKMIKADFTFLIWEYFF